MKEMVGKDNHNSSGVVGVTFGILSLVAFLIPVLALILAIIGFFFAWNQKKKMPNPWSKAGLWLCGIGIVLGITWNVYYVVSAAKFVAQYQNQIQGLSQQAGAVDPSAYANYGN